MRKICMHVIYFAVSDNFIAGEEQDGKHHACKHRSCNDAVAISETKSDTDSLTNLYGYFLINNLSFFYRLGYH